MQWILANGAGMALGFLVFIQTLMFLAFGLDLGLHWRQEVVNELDEAEAERLLRIGLAIGIPLAGTIFTSSQALVMRGLLPRVRTWILAGPVGFISVSLVIWPLTAIWGDIPGPVEPFTIVGVGLFMTAFLQWLSLRRRGITATRWLVLWLAGLPLGMVVFVLAYTLLDAVILPGAEYSIGWATEVALIGFFVGGTAGALSGRALLCTIGGASADGWPSKRTVGHRS